jgi:uncharacterized membrane protein
LSVAEIRAAETAEIAAPIERVYGYRLDFTNLPSYNPNVTNLRRVDAGSEPGAGAEYLFDLALPGIEPMESPLRVIEAVAPTRIVFETGPGYMAREVCVFTSKGDVTHAEFELTLTMPGEVDDATRELFEGNTREQARMELDLIKKALEP